MNFAKLDISRRRYFAYWAVTVFVAAVICFAIGEIAARIKGSFPLETGWVSDPHLGWRPSQFAPPPFDPADRYVIVLGDSFSQGKPYVDRLARELSGCRPRTTVVNLGVGGFGTVQEREMLRRYGLAYGPTVVILQILMWNDLADNLNDIYYSSNLGVARPHIMDIERDTVAVGRPLLPTVLTRYSALFRAIEGYAVKYMRIGGVRLYTDFEHYKDFYSVEPNSRSERAYATMGKMIDSIAKESESAGARFMIAGLDGSFTVESSVRDREMARTNGRFAALDQDRPMRWLDGMTKDRGFHYLNITEILRAKKSADPSFIAYREFLEGHLTDAGNEVFGKTLGHYILRNGLLHCAEPVERE